jgi:OOP family OmpA-OmpF porin
MNQLKSAALAAALSLAYAGTAAAEVEPGFYAGVGVGQSTVEVDDIDFDEDDTGFKVFGGYQFNQYFAVELAYIDGGSPDANILPGLNFEAEVTQINASAVGTIPFNDYFGAMGRLGFSSVDAETRATGLGSDDDTETAFAYGLGVWFAPVKNFVLRLEYEMAQPEFDDVDVDLTLITVSAAYKFGR